jgi:hypothetical protein
MDKDDNKDQQPLKLQETGKNNADSLKKSFHI